MVAAQWYAPVSMIFQSEKTIENGKEYRFKTFPVDPADPFRGKYITLQYEAQDYHPADTSEISGLESGQLIYARLGVDSAGFAKIEKLDREPPVIGSDYLTLELVYIYDNIVTFDFPFKEFYLEESKASQAEQLYWQSRTDSLVMYAKVKVLNGDSKLVDVIVNDSSIVDVVRRINANKKD
jgi:uncharacterized membrane-anchored protein